MPDRGQNKETGRQRAVSGSSGRPSRAVGSEGLPRVQGKRVEQRSNMSAPRQNARSPITPRRAKAGGATTRKSPVTPAPSARTNRPVGVAPPAADPRDVQFVKWAGDKWSSLETHHQQRVFSSGLLVLSLLLFGSLTVFSTQPILRGIHTFFLALFGWSAYLLALGLVAFALIHLIEGIRRQYILRISMVGGLVVIWLLVLIESRLLLGTARAGLLAEVLVVPFLGWSPVISQIVLLGLILIAIIMTFRITFGHVLLFTRFVQRMLADDPRDALAENAPPTPSPFLGQRPQFSRYAPGRSLAGEAALSRQGAVAKGNQARGAGRPVADDLDFAEDEDNVEFEADFDIADEYDDDPLNDITIHKQDVGMVPRGARGTPRSHNPEELRKAINGVRQQPLTLEPSDPIEHASADEPTQLLKSATPMAMPPMPPLPPKAEPAKARGSKASALLPEITSPWTLPSTTLLNNPEVVKSQLLGDDTSTLAKTIQDTLRSFRVDAEVRPEDISIGPTIIRFGIRPTGKPEMRQDEKTGKMVPVLDGTGQIIYETRTRVSRIMALQNDLALVLEAKTIRMEAPVPGRPYVGVEIPNKNSRLVTLREVLESKEYLVAKAKSKLTIGLGKDVGGVVRVGDLARMPHLLIAGATGSGKSVAINTIIASILTQATPDDVRLLMVDPKMVELNMYNDIPHLLSPVVIEVEKVVSLLKNAIGEMERRYRLFSQLGVRNLDAYRKLRQEKKAQGDISLNNLPAIVIIIDELADLMMAAPEEVEGMICRLAQLARATGIHLVVATQRPSVDVITGLIKANIPTRISFMVSSSVDSRTIIDMGGAERLLGRGDMLYLPADAGRPERVQGAFLSDEEAQTLADYWRAQVAVHAAAIDDATAEAARPLVEPGWELKNEPLGEDEELDDDLLDKAEDIVREYGRASISLLQRRLKVGYSRAARLIDLLEERGIIGRSESGGRGREVYEGGQDHHGGNGHSLADEVADIVAEEKARDEFLRNQADRFQPQQAPSDKGSATPLHQQRDSHER